MNKLKRLLTNWRIIILIVALLLAVLAIRPALDAEGIAIRAIAPNSSAAIAGIPAPDPGASPTSRERIISVDSQQILTVQQFYEYVNVFTLNDVGRKVIVQTDRQFYEVELVEEFEITYLNSTEEVERIEQYFNESTNATENRTVVVEVPETESKSLGVKPFGITVFEAPRTNIRKGLDLSGGTRVILEPEEAVSAEDLEIIVESIKQRLNVFGLSDITVRPASDLTGKDFIIVEIAGATKDEVIGLIANQGKFEAKIGNETVFIGGQRDVTYVCTSAQCSGLYGGCGPAQEGFACSFRFSISLDPEAAKRHADITGDLGVVLESGQSFLSEDLELYLDDQLVDTLRIGAELKGRATTDIQISGSGVGPSQSDAARNAQQEMKELQTILKTGSLPTKLNIVKSDTISAALGAAFVKNALLIGALAILSVVVVVVIRYRNIKIGIPIGVTMACEVLLILGAAALIKWNIDLAAIAGILIAVGTGVDHQIVIVDEAFYEDGRRSSLSWKEKLRRAFFIIFAAFFTTIVAMIPLFVAGAGLLRGFAMTTIIGLLIGVLITRPAFAAFIAIMFDE